MAYIVVVGCEALLRVVGGVIRERAKAAIEQQARWQKAADEAKPFVDCDHTEKMVLRQFVDLGIREMDRAKFNQLLAKVIESGLASSEQLSKAITGLESRTLLYFDRDHFDSGRWFLRQDHFRILSTRPALVGSDASPKQLG